MTTNATGSTWMRRFQFALIWTSGFLAVNMAALPFNQRVETCAFSNAQFESLMLPVLPGDPLKEGRQKAVVFDLLISPEGKLMGRGAYYAPDQSYIPPVANALALSYYSPALECGIPVPGFIRHTVNSYFFPAKPGSGADWVEAQPLWVLDRKLANSIGAISRMGKESFSLIQFQIDEKGAVIRVKSTSPVGKSLIKHFFKPMKTRLKFAPATRAGKPVRSELTLRLASGEQSLYTKARDPAAPSAQPMPRYPQGESIDRPIEVVATVDFGADGIVQSARVDENASEAFALEVIKTIRSWRFSVGHEDDRRVIKTVTCRFGFVQGEETAILLSEPEEVSFTAPNPTKRVGPVYPLSLKTNGISGFVEAVFVVDLNGRVSDIKIVRSSHPQFSNATITALGQWRFEPGRLNGEPVAVRMKIPMKFQVK